MHHLGAYARPSFITQELFRIKYEEYRRREEPQKPQGGRGGKEKHKSTTANLQIMVYAKRPDGLPELDHSVKLNPHMD